jgi:hypothetical protein
MKWSNKEIITKMDELYKNDPIDPKVLKDMVKNMSRSKFHIIRHFKNENKKVN